MINVIFSRKFCSKWLFDLEILCRFRLVHGDIPMSYWGEEVPLTKWRDVGKSKVRFQDVFKTPFELFKIWWRYRFLTFRIPDAKLSAGGNIEANISNSYSGVPDPLIPKA